MKIWPKNEFLNLLEYHPINNGFMLKILIILILISSFGCTPGIKKEWIGPKPIPEEILVPPSSPAPPLEDINMRIHYFEELLQSVDLEEEKKEMAEELLSSYRYLQSSMEEKMGAVDEQQIINLLFRTLGELEQRFFTQKPALVEQPCQKSMDEFSKQRHSIIEAFFSNNHDRVISECIDMESSLGPDSLTPEIGLVFAISLSKMGMLREAINVGERILRELEGRPGKTDLVAGIIEWQLKLGERENALGNYEKMIDILNEEEFISSQIKQKFAKEEDDKSNLSKEREVTEIVSLSDILNALPDRHYILDVERLLRNNEFDKAKLVLLQAKLRTEDENELKLIEKALDILEVEEKGNMDRIDERNNIDMAITLIEQEKYEEALEILEEKSDNTLTFVKEKQRLKDLAIEQLINKERNRAANIFLTAKNSSNPENKAALFEESFNILSSLIEKYPESPLIPKLNANLQQVKKEMEKHNP